MKTEIPVWKKSNLTIQEAVAYFGIGMQKLRQLTAKEDWMIIMRCSTFAVVFVLLTSAKPLLQVCNTAHI